MPISTMRDDIRIRTGPKNDRLPCTLAQVDWHAWDSWTVEHISPDPTLRLPPLELVVEAEIVIGQFRTKATVLVDTGCRIPLLFRSTLIPSQYITKADYPINITTADNSPMTGGTHGCRLEVHIPIFSGVYTSSERPLKCLPIWGYECGIYGTDIIIGYPFLKLNRLTVDCTTDTLTTGTPVPTKPTRDPTTTTRTRKFFDNAATRPVEAFPGGGAPPKADTPPRR
jgi:hypothetical protein